RTSRVVSRRRPRLGVSCRPGRGVGAAGLGAEDRARPARGVDCPPWPPTRTRADCWGRARKGATRPNLRTPRRRRSGSVCGVDPACLFAGCLLGVDDVDGAEEWAPVAVFAGLLEDTAVL